MPMQIVLMTIGCLSGGFLLWCLNGFTRALKQGRRVIGLVVNLAEVDARSRASDKMRRNAGKVVVLPRWRSDISKARKGGDPGWRFRSDRSPKG
jgi:hypothetical protein